MNSVTRGGAQLSLQRVVLMPLLLCLPLSPETLMGIVNGRYRYMEDLLKLERVFPFDDSETPVPVVLGFLPLSEWEPFLASYPDQAFADYLR